MTLRWLPTEDPPDMPSEFSWGRGLRPKGLQSAPPDEGGMYGGKSPATAPGRRGKVRSGHPGERVRP